MQQLGMFQTEDLPLFSGTAQRGKLEVFKPGEVAHQDSFARCPVCLDTGSFDGHQCTCDAAPSMLEVTL